MRSLLTQKQPKKKLPKVLGYDEELLEPIRELGTSLTRSIKRDVAQEGIADLWKQILNRYEDSGKEASRLTGELAEGEEVDISQLTKTRKAESQSHHKRADIAPGMEYGREYTRSIIQVSERSMQKDQHEIKERVEDILVEIKRLIDTSEDMKQQFVHIAIEQRPAEVGKYHLSFFEWMLNILSEARRKIEDAGSWMAVLASKKQKLSYWAMFKKHGTTFGLSNERTVATQTG
jgi:hypothetical protein